MMDKKDSIYNNKILNLIIKLHLQWYNYIVIVKLHKKILIEKVFDNYQNFND